MYPILFTVFGVPVDAFWTSVAAGFLVALLVVRSELRRQGHDPNRAYDLILWSYIGGFVGARLFLIVTAWDQFQADPFELLFSGSGWVWQGGVLGGAVAVIWKVRQVGLPLGDVADIAGLALSIGQAIGRASSLQYDIIAGTLMRQPIRPFASVTRCSSGSMRFP